MNKSKIVISMKDPILKGLKIKITVREVELLLHEVNLQNPELSSFCLPGFVISF